MQKTMSKQVTHTTVKVAKMVKGENGLPVAEQLPDVTLLGNASLEKAQKEVSKRYDEPVQVFEVQADTQTYEMSVEEFIKVATVKDPNKTDEIEAPSQATE